MEKEHIDIIQQKSCSCFRNLASCMHWFVLLKVIYLDLKRRWPSGLVLIICPHNATSGLGESLSTLRFDTLEKTRDPFTSIQNKCDHFFLGSDIRYHQPGRFESMIFQTSPFGGRCFLVPCKVSHDRFIETMVVLSYAVLSRIFACKKTTSSYFLSKNGIWTSVISYGYC